MYPYRPLSTPKSIRLFELFPSFEGENLQGRMLDTTLDDCPNYEAISYVWGSEIDKITIQCDGHELQITQNLAGALRRFQLPDVGRLLWIDSICINQDDVLEKNHQIPLMGDIYRNASCVLIWLGEADYQWEETHKAMTCVSQLEELQQTRKKELMEMRDLGRDRKNMSEPRNLELIQSRFAIPAIDSTEFSALAKFLKRPWFSRAWTFQESFVASERAFYCGPHTFAGSVLTHAFLALSLLFECTDHHVYSECLRPSGAMLLGEIVPYAQVRLSSLVRLLGYRRAAGCKDPRDLVYSLLGAASNNVKIGADYARPVEYVFADATVQIIRSDGRLRVLDYVWPDVGRTMLPSWVPDWRTSSRNIRYHSITESFGNGSYNSSGTSRATVQVSNDMKEITLQGIKFDQVQIISHDPHIVSAYLATKQHAALNRDPVIYKPTAEILELAMGRIFAMDRDTSNLKKPDARWAPDSFESHSSGDELRWNMILDRQARKLAGKQLVSTRQEALGIVPEWAEPGDAIVVFMGGEVPYLLRPDPSDEKYTFVGECYLHGFMDGEVLRQARRKVQPEYDDSDTSWLDSLGEGTWPFSTEGFTIK